MSTHVDFEQQLLDTIEIIAENKIEKAGYDKTIKAIILKCENNISGQYSVRYQDSEVYAYASNPDIKYKENSLVYILIPEGDFSQRKTIIGAVEDTNAEYGTVIEEKDSYEYIGKNCIESVGSFSLCSYKNNTKLLYDKDSEINLINLNLNDTNLYFKSASSFSIGGKIRTALPAEQKSKGNYGIAIEIAFNDNNNEEVLKTFILDINNMIGDPYAYIGYTEQKTFFNIENSNFKYINKIYIFNYDFPVQKENKTDDIYFSELQLYATSKITDEELNNYGLILKTPKGIYFDDNDLKDATRIINAQMLIKGKTIDTDSKYIKYYWFKENNSISSTSDKYCRYGGYGWECLNDYNIISDEYENETIEWIPSIYQLIVTKENLLAKENRYKCVGIYMDNYIASKEITVINNSSNYDITINSTNGTYFFQDNGETSLTCLINGEEQASNFSYVWSVVDSNNSFNVLTRTEAEILAYNEAKQDYNNLMAAIAAGTIIQSDYQNRINTDLNIINKYENDIQVNGNRIDNLKINTIKNFSIYKCSVYKNENFIGTNSITIINDPNPDKNDLNYTLLIENGNQFFQYNENGVSPASRSQDAPQTIYPLSFVLYDDNGNDIKENLLLANIKWKVPKTDTLLSISNQYLPFEEEDDYIIYRGYKELAFEIKNIYSIKKDKNDIQLIVEYDNQIITARTNLTFIKQGEIGTNGTDIVCRIIPNIAESSLNKPSYPIVTIRSNNSYSWNYTPKITSRYFKAELWEDGELVTDTNDLDTLKATVKWEILKNQYNQSVSDRSNYYINQNTGEISVDITNYYENYEEYPSNIVKCTFEYKNKIYSSVMPIITVWNNADYSISIKPDENSGFKTALYLSNGIRPSYDSDNPFKVNVYYNNDENVSDSYTYIWESLGSEYGISNAYLGIEDWISRSSLEERSSMNKNLPKNEKYYKPVEKFDGFIINNAIIVNIYGIGYVHFPVYMYLNKYSQAALNEWDGNSIKIDENGKYIIAPQVGAGTKDNQNRFTGVFMGEVREPYTEKKEVGLFGYSAGERTIFLDASNGIAEFGIAGRGQIVLDGTQSIIEGGDFQRETSYQSGQGMLIDLQSPSIEWGNGNFSVDYNGKMSAKIGKIGAWTIHEDGYLYADTFFGNTQKRVYIQQVLDDHKEDTWVFSIQEGTVNGNGFYSLFNVLSNGEVSALQLKPGNEISLKNGLPDSAVFPRGYTTLAKNGIVMVPNKNGNDAGWIRFYEGTVNGGWMEISTGDDGTEPIYVKQYNTSSNVAHSITLLDSSGCTWLDGGGGVVLEGDTWIQGGVLNISSYLNGSMYLNSGKSAYINTNGLGFDCGTYYNYNECVIKGQLIVNSDAWADHWYTNSLEEKKKDFEKFENGLDIIKNTDIYKYKFKTDSCDTKKHIGFVIGNEYNYSQELTSNNNDAVDVYAMASVCFAAIKEQQKQIEQLNKKIKELEGSI